MKNKKGKSYIDIYDELEQKNEAKTSLTMLISFLLLLVIFVLAVLR
jgi:hypothetical protein